MPNTIRVLIVVMVLLGCGCVVLLVKEQARSFGKSFNEELEKLKNVGSFISDEPYCYKERKRR